MELDLKDEEERPNDAMEIDSNGIEKESSPKKANSSKILSNGMEVMLEWDNEGIVFDHKEHLWTTIKYWQNKVRRQTKDPIRTRFWKGPYATCWCIYQKAYCRLDNDDSCNRCEYWITVLHYVSKIPNDALEHLIAEHIIHPWFRPAKEINQEWQNANFAESFQVKLLSKRAIMPNKAYHGDAAWDVFAAETCKPDEQGIIIIPTHIQLRYKPGHYGKLETKSSQAKKSIQVLGGILDEGYTGEIKVILKVSNPHIEINPGDKIAQLIIHQRVDAHVENEELTIRGNKAFGSSGSAVEKTKILKINQVLKKEISEEQQEQISKLLENYSDIFRQESNDINTTVKHTQHFIKLSDHLPIHEANRAMAPAKKIFLQEEINKMLKTGVISKSPENNPWGFQVVIVKKKDGTLRLLYRNLEFLTISSRARLDIDTSLQRSRIVATPVRARNDIVGTCTQDCEII